MPRCPKTGRFQKGGSPETERPPNMMTAATPDVPPEIRRPEADLLLRQLRLSNETLRIFRNFFIVYFRLPANATNNQIAERMEVLLRNR